MKILILGAPGQQMGLSSLLAHRPDIQVVAEVPEPKRDPLEVVIDVRPPPVSVSPFTSLNIRAPYYEHHRRRANRRKR